jgi:hypothetical protein
MVDVADLDQLDAYGYDRDRSWSPDEATAMAIRLQAFPSAQNLDLV